MINNPSLAEFLTGKNTNYSSNLPLVHSFESRKLATILSGKKVKVTECDTFKNESLAYFFLGRPSYRKEHKNAKEWQLPTVLIFKSTCLLQIKRIFPFDTGAFSKGLYPSYITDLGRDGYECMSVKNAQDLIIETFFGDDSSYLSGKPYSLDEVAHRSKLGVKHHEIMALAALYSEPQASADDRSKAIEFQTDRDVPIVDQLLGCVLPRPYFEDDELKAVFKGHGIQVRHYDVYSLDTEAYMASIYGEVKKIYGKLGLIR